MTPLEALRAIGCTDDEIRALAKCLLGYGYSSERCDESAEACSIPGATPYIRLDAAILRAAEQLGPEREWVTRDTPLGTEVGHDDFPSRRYTLVGWKRSGDVVTETERNFLDVWYPDGWYVVKGADDE